MTLTAGTHFELWVCEVGEGDRERKLYEGDYFDRVQESVLSHTDEVERSGGDLYFWEIESDDNGTAQYIFNSFEEWGDPKTLVDYSPNESDMGAEYQTYIDTWRAFSDSPDDY